ncbi:MAG: adenylate kinase [Ignavibacteriae bacterium]|nr:adenylate kinase [Ignavibacteriota bacterium]NOG98207.1 adenylate kinase [Ignavibacteriota bacterium]
MQIVIFGAPGVGKGTQAKILSSRLNIRHISTGDILRESIKNKTELGRKAKEIVDQGNLVPDDLMGGLIKEVLMEEESQHGYILDGFPRTLNQATILDKILEELDHETPHYISLEAEDSVIVERLSQRRMCSVCNSIVNLKNLENTSVCPFCKSENSFIKREDDDAEVIQNRLNVFHNTTSPVIEHYKRKNKVIVLDGTLPVNIVTDKILDVLDIKL